MFFITFLFVAFHSSSTTKESSISHWCHSLHSYTLHSQFSSNVWTYPYCYKAFLSTHSVTSHISLLKWHFHTHHPIHITVAISFQSAHSDNISLKGPFCCLNPWQLSFTYRIHSTLHFLSSVEFGGEPSLADNTSYSFTHTFIFHSHSYILSWLTCLPFYHIFNISVEFLYTYMCVHVQVYTLMYTILIHTIHRLIYIHTSHKMCHIYI